MTIEKTDVTLTIEWDNEQDNHPFNWDWPDLIDTESSRVIAVEGEDLE